MKDPRLIYRIILKLLVLSGIGIMLYVLVGSLFVGGNQIDKTKKAANLITLDLSEMKKNEIRRTQWEGKPVIVLKRSDKPQYHVYFNTGDSGNCPLFYASKIFKDTCTGTLYNQGGREINKSTPKLLSIPPHSFNGNVLIIGK